MVEPVLELKSGEILVTENETFETCRECGGQLVDRFTYILDYHRWRVIKARCERCGKKYVQPKRIL